jgi:micrococcal nuclease
MATTFMALWLVLAQTDEATGRVTRVFDGDTAVVEIDGRREIIRFLGVDTPETDGPYTRRERCGAEATRFTRDALDGKIVRLLFDGPDRRDKHGRLLAYVLLADGSSHNEALLVAGFATYYRRFDYGKKSVYRTLEKTARKRRVGLWSDPPVCAPVNR